MKKIIIIICFALSMISVNAQTVDSSLIKNNQWNLWERLTDKQQAQVEHAFNNTHDEIVLPGSLPSYKQIRNRVIGSIQATDAKQKKELHKFDSVEQTLLLMNFITSDKEIILLTNYSGEYLHQKANGQWIYIYDYVRRISDTKYKRSFICLQISGQKPYAASLGTDSVLTDYADMRTDLLLASGY